MGTPDMLGVLRSSSASKLTPRDIPAGRLIHQRARIRPDPPKNTIAPRRRMCSPRCRSASSNTVSPRHRPWIILNLLNPLEAQKHSGQNEQCFPVWRDGRDQGRVWLALLFRRGASRHASLADFYCAFGMTFLRYCYHQILRPHRHLPKFSDSLCRYAGAYVRLNPHLGWQAAES
jgi:hypothetical protein